MRILLATNDEGVGQALAFGLSKHGHDVRWVKTADEAVEAEADVALVDYDLPGLDAPELCKRLRAGSDVGVIAMTTRWEDPDDVVAAREADDYLIKPVALRDVLAAMDAVQGRSQPETPVA